MHGMQKALNQCLLNEIMNLPATFHLNQMALVYPHLLAKSASLPWPALASTSNL